MCVGCERSSDWNISRGWECPRRDTGMISEALRVSRANRAPSTPSAFSEGLDWMELNRTLKKAAFETPVRAI